eukprot:TRINITY_DN75013_c0_g1_i1.p1 TRINITY_DN75013_c0_g1~~TRINITY_DN75013_c0_g1_i1.p1  ORF type:complete len:291 (+),score=47.96 TRINITY_DN75013_c0_g1_i1:182-1054(+)
MMVQPAPPSQPRPSRLGRRSQLRDAELLLTTTSSRAAAEAAIKSIARPPCVLNALLASEEPPRPSGRQKATTPRSLPPLTSCRAASPRCSTASTAVGSSPSSVASPSGSRPGTTSSRDGGQGPPSTPRRPASAGRGGRAAAASPWHARLLAAGCPAALTERSPLAAAQQAAEEADGESAALTESKQEEHGAHQRSALTREGGEESCESHALTTSGTTGAAAGEGGLGIGRRRQETKGGRSFFRWSFRSGAKAASASASRAVAASAACAARAVAASSARRSASSLRYEVAP